MEEAIARFWLDGPLAITPEEQITFLRRLCREDLLFSQQTIDLVKDIIVFEQTPEYVLHAKTGWEGEVGWFIGYLEQNKNVYFFATNLVIRNPRDAAARIEITRCSLRDLGLL